MSDFPLLEHGKDSPNCCDELERLREESAWYKRATDAEAEVERLQWSLKNADEDNDVLKAEVERQREGAQGFEDAWHREMDWRQREQAEVERLREELEEARLLKLSELGGDFSTIKADRDQLRARLRRIEEAALLFLQNQNQHGIAALRAALGEEA